MYGWLYAIDLQVKIYRETDKMNNRAWVSGAMADPRQLRPLTNDIGEADLQRCVDITDRNSLGERLCAESFPQAIWPAEHAERSWDEMPDLFYGFGYWVVSKACADILKQFDLGGGALYPVDVFKKDRKTRVRGEYFCLNFGNVKRAFLPDKSPKTRDHPVNRRALPFVLSDFDIALSTDSLNGPDIWIDPLLAYAFFLSGPLGDALKAAKVSRWFKLKKCQIIE